MAQLQYTQSERDYLRAKGARIEDEEPDNQFMWQSYLNLRSSKAETGYIPIGAVADYCEFMGITNPIQKTRLLRFVGALDQVEVEHGNAKAKS